VGRIRNRGKKRKKRSLWENTHKARGEPTNMLHAGGTAEGNVELNHENGNTPIPRLYNLSWGGGTSQGPNSHLGGGGGGIGGEGPAGAVGRRLNQKSKGCTQESAYKTSNPFPKIPAKAGGCEEAVSVEEKKVGGEEQKSTSN